MKSAEGGAARGRGGGGAARCAAARALAVRRPPRGLLGGLLGAARRRARAGRGARGGLARALRERIGLVAGARDAGRAPSTHGFTHRALRLHVFRAEAPAGRVRRRELDAHRWLAPAAFEGLPLSAVAKKALALLDAHG